MSDELFVQEEEVIWTDREARAWLKTLGYSVDAEGGSGCQCDWRLVTPLHEAADQGHIDMVKWLAARGADVRAVDNYGQTPVHRAAKRGHFDALEWLLDNGAEEDIHKVDLRGKTPHDLACRGGHTMITGYLFERGSVNAGSRIYIENWNANRGPLICFED